MKRSPSFFPANVNSSPLRIGFRADTRDFLLLLPVKANIYTPNSRLISSEERRIYSESRFPEGKGQQPHECLESVSIPEPGTKLRLSRLQIRAEVYGVPNGRGGSPGEEGHTFIGRPAQAPQNLEEEESQEET